ncbi:MAG: hypothetical protein A2Z14_04270 [Chloroflexi bacterium RBG_16_48_8]|nr:MAG: hypothetical protein A2Z14_04270 [Chloroflexi bacterium RBG_16_48_8]
MRREDHKGLENKPEIEISKSPKITSIVATPQLRSSTRHFCPLASGPVIEKAIHNNMTNMTQTESLSAMPATISRDVNHSTRVLVANHSKALSEGQLKKRSTVSIITTSAGFAIEKNELG